MVGLCGPIGAGKSAVLETARSLGWDTVDVDRLAHGLYAAGTPLARAIFEAFGDGVRKADGAVDRKTLGAVVFGDPERMRELEGLVHPAVHREMDRLVESARESGIRLLLEAAILPRRPEFCAGLDAVLAVMAPEELRLERVMERDGISREAALSRLARAVPPEDVLAVATLVLENSGTREELAAAARLCLESPA